jgi:hypothetical protein
MGVMYDYFRSADDDLAKRVGGVRGGPVAAGHLGVVESKGVDPHVRVGRLHFQVIYRPWQYDDSLATQVPPEVPIGPDNWEEPTVHRLSDQLRDSLAGVPDDRREEVGRWWAGTEGFVLDRVEPAQVVALCDALLTLCRDARDRDQHVFVWSSL